MSVATEFAPSVPIPPRARAARHLHAVALAVPPRAATPGGATATTPAAVSVLRAPASTASAVPVRLTRAGVVVLAFVVAVLGVALVWVASVSAPDPAIGAAAASAPASVTVRAGDTLWSIAGRVAPQRDSRAEVAILRRLNHLRNVDLVPGQQLHVR